MAATVAGYMKRQKSPKRLVLQRLRRIILKTFPGIEERMRFGVPWYGRYYIAALRDGVNIGFPVQGLKRKDLALFKGKGRFMRHMKILSLDDIDEKRIVKLLKVAKKSKCTC